MKKSFGFLDPIFYISSIAVKEQRAYPLLLFGIFLLRGLSPFINIVMIKLIINELTHEAQAAIIIGYILVMTTGTLAAGLLDGLLQRKLDNCHRKVDLALEYNAASKIINADYELFDDADFHVKAESSKLTVFSYVGGIGKLSEILGIIVASLFSIIGAIYIIFSVSLWLVALMIGVVAVNSLILSYASKKDVFDRKKQSILNHKFDYYTKIGQMREATKDIRVYAASDMIIKRSNDYRDEYLRIDLRRKKYINRYNSITTFLSSIQMVALYITFGYFTITATIAIADYQMLLASAILFSRCLSDILMNLVKLRSTADLISGYKLFMETQSNKSYGDQELGDADDYEIEFYNVSFRYKNASENALTGINLKISSRERLAIVGENGAGKTTLIKLLVRLYDPCEGKILINGVDIRDLTKKSLLEAFAVVFQDYGLPSLSVAESIAITSNYDRKKMIESLKKVNFWERTEQLNNGVQTIIGKSIYEEGTELSGGEMQKLAIARALYKNAKIAILDEPTASLDPEMELEIYKNFDTVIDGRTAIYISHRLSCCLFCDNIAVFSKGKIVEYGRHKNLIAADGIYRLLWSTQAKNYL
ncbi:MAG: ABC transporter ATP-binding protein/permease [Clostridiales bacterium]|nr:ABC transporter ATP-binding protein/permease [Clostridiales bacterium]